MATVSEEEAASQLDALLDRVEAGEEVVTTRRGRSVARMVRAASTKSPLPLERLAVLRATAPRPRRPSSALLREMREDGL